MPFPTNVIEFSVDVGIQKPCIIDVSGIVLSTTPKFIVFTTGTKYLRSAITSPIKNFYTRQVIVV